MTLRVHQLLPTWEPGAIGTHALALHHMLRDEGIECQTWASEIKPGIENIAKNADELMSDERLLIGSVLLYHTAVGAPLGDELLLRGEPLVLDHHNVTPPHYFDAWFPAMAENLEVGEAQVAKLASKAILGIADSRFNEQQLHDYGCKQTIVAPVWTHLDKPCDEEFLADLCRNPLGSRWLFVGRVAPNKAPHAVVTAFAWYRRAFDPMARLWLVGGGPSDAYRSTLVRLIARLGLDECVVMTGLVSEVELGAYYAAADVYVSLSTHEGFGVPILEAMAAGVPVIALEAGAIADTAGGAALLIDRDDPGLVAACVARVLRDSALNASLIEAGRKRAQQFSPQQVSAIWRDTVVPKLKALVG